LGFEVVTTFSREKLNDVDIQKWKEDNVKWLKEAFNANSEKYGDNPESMQKAGVLYATDQIIELFANDVKGIHLYTMNKVEAARDIMNNISFAR